MTVPPRILFFGDPHGDLEAVASATLALRPQAIVLLGDVEAANPLDEELAAVLDAQIAVHWIHGNHDQDGGPTMWGNLTSGTWNPRTAAGALHGRVVDVAGISVAGLGGIFRESAWLPPEPPVMQSLDELAKKNRKRFPGVWRGKSMEQRDTIFPNDVEALKKHRAEILVTHEAPSSHRDGYGVLDELARALGVRLVVHGHHHQDYASKNADGLLVVGVGQIGACDEDGTQRYPSAASRQPKRVVGWTRLR